MDDRDRPNYEERSYANGKLRPRKGFVRRYLWQIIAIVSVALVVLLLYLNIASHQASAPAPATASARQTPVAQATAALTQNSVPAATVTPATSPTSAVQSNLPCNVNLSTWTDGSADWKVLNGTLLDDGTNGNWRSDDGPTIVAPCQLGNVSNYAVEAKIQVVSINGYACFGLTVRGNPSSNGWQGYKAGVGDCYSGDGLNKARISGPDYLNDSQIKDATFSPGTTVHTYRVEVKDNTITFFIDGSQILTMADNRYLTGAETGLWSENVQLQVSSFQVTAL